MSELIITKSAVFLCWNTRNLPTDKVEIKNIEEKNATKINLKMAYFLKPHEENILKIVRSPTFILWTFLWILHDFKQHLHICYETKIIGGNMTLSVCIYQKCDQNFI